MKKIKNIKIGKQTTIFMVFILAVIIIGSRNFGALLLPTLYAEDGTWLSKLFEYKFLHTAFHAREFPVVGLVSLLKLSLIINNLVFNHNIGNIPYSIYIVSTIFYASVATLGYFALPSKYSITSRLLIFSSILFMPVGSDGNEIFGRILNLGFLFPTLQTIFFIGIISDNEKGLAWKITTVIFCTIAALTFPVSIAINCIGAFFILMHYINNKNECNNDLRLVALSLLILTFLAVSALDHQAFISKGGADLPYNAKGLTEFVFARMIAYPIIFKFYSKLNDITTLGIGVSLIVAITSCITFLSIRQRSKSLAIWLITSCFTLYIASMIIMRSGFSSFFGNYTTTFPDRYFYGINIIFMILVTVLLEMLANETDGHKYIEKTIITIKSFLFVILFIGIPRQFAIHQPEMNWDSHGSFQQTLCTKSEQMNNDTMFGDYVVIDIYPDIPVDMWKMRVPKQYFIDSVKNNCTAVFHHETDKMSN